MILGGKKLLEEDLESLAALFRKHMKGQNI